MAADQRLANVAVDAPRIAAVPLVLDSPHSGTVYPPDFDFQVELRAVQRLEDGYVDRLIADAPEHGATVVRALFPRAYIDPNRHPTDIDPTTLSAPWQGLASPSRKTELGVGLVFTRTLDGRELYAAPLSPADVRRRIRRYYEPYHAALGAALDDLHRRFGVVWHLNCHSMPALGVATAGERRPDFCIGDRHGTTCGADLTALVADTLAGSGYRVTVNDPYPGVELVSRYGRPAEGRHSIQVEVNRALYMDEGEHRLHSGWRDVRACMAALVARLAGVLDDRLARAAE